MRKSFQSRSSIHCIAKKTIIEVYGLFSIVTSIFRFLHKDFICAILRYVYLLRCNNYFEKLSPTLPKSEN